MDQRRRDGLLDALLFAQEVSSRSAVDDAYYKTAAGSYTNLVGVLQTSGNSWGPGGRTVWQHLLGRTIVGSGPTFYCWCGACHDGWESFAELRGHLRRHLTSLPSVADMKKLLGAAEANEAHDASHGQSSPNTGRFEPTPASARHV